MPTVPPFNADPTQVPYLRWVQESILTLQRDSARRAENENNTNRGQSGTIDALQVQVQGLAEAQVLLAEAYQSAATAEELAETAGDVAAVASSLATVANNARISPYVDSTGTSGFTLTTGGITVISRSVSVPSGFTRALVLATGFVHGLGSSSGDRVFGLVTINGNNGSESQSVGSINQLWAAVSPSHAVNLTGLSGSFNVSLQGRIGTGPGGSSLTNATLTIMALFLP
jgi:hypothetical protein